MEEEIVSLDDTPKSYIDVADDLRLTISARNWQLQKKTVAQSGKNKGVTTWSSFRYYTSLQSALNDVVHIGLSKQKFNTLQSFLEAHTRVISSIKEALSPDFIIKRT